MWTLNLPLHYSASWDLYFRMQDIILKCYFYSSTTCLFSHLNQKQGWEWKTSPEDLEYILWQKKKHSKTHCFLRVYLVLWELAWLDVEISSAPDNTPLASSLLKPSFLLTTKPKDKLIPDWATKHTEISHLKDLSVIWDYSEGIKFMCSAQWHYSIKQINIMKLISVFRAILQLYPN